VRFQHDRVLALAAGATPPLARRLPEP
jgi:hypothetical protein